MLSKPVRLCRASDPSDLSDPSDKTAHSAGACTPTEMHSFHRGRALDGDAPEPVNHWETFA